MNASEVTSPLAVSGPVSKVSSSGGAAPPTLWRLHDTGLVGLKGSDAAGGKCVRWKIALVALTKITFLQ